MVSDAALCSDDHKCKEMDVLAKTVQGPVFLSQDEQEFEVVKSIGTSRIEVTEVQYETHERAVLMPPCGFRVSLR